MIRRSFRIGLLLGLLAGIAIALSKVAAGRPPETAPASNEPWPPLQPDPAVPTAAAPVAAAAPVVDPAAPAPPVPKKAPAKRQAASAWVEPTDGACPTSHPVKGKLSSKIFHRPGMLNYDRTNADRCYRDDGAAEADGLRAAKR